MDVRSEITNYCKAVKVQALRSLAMVLLATGVLVSLPMTIAAIEKPITHVCMDTYGAIEERC